MAKFDLPDHVTDAVNKLVSVIDGHVMGKLMEQGKLAGLSAQVTHTGQEFGGSQVVQDVTTGPEITR